MELFYDKQYIKERLDELELKYEGASERVDDVFNAYSELMKNDFYKDAGIKTQKSIINQIEDQMIREGASFDEFMNFKSAQFSGIEHMEFYTRFLGEEEALKMQSALRLNKIDFNILRGVKAKEFGVDRYPSMDKSAELVVEWESINGSPQIVGLEIIKNGNTVYSYGKKRSSEKEPPPSNSLNIIKKAPTKKEKEKLPNLLQNIFINETKYRLIKTKRGLRYINNKGQWVSGSLFE